MKLIKATASIFLIVCILFCGNTLAAADIPVDSIPTASYTDIEDCTICSQSTNKTLRVIPPFIIVLLHSEASLFSPVLSVVFVNTKVTLIGYSGAFAHVSVENQKGYIFKTFLSDDGGLLITKSSEIFVGNARNILKDYKNPQDFSWSVSDNSIVSVDTKTGIATGISPGTATVTAKYNGKSHKCIVTVINKWAETEIAVAAKNISVKSNPESLKYSTYEKGVIKANTEIIARGDMSDGSGWIYVSDFDGSVWGFIKLSDFPGIDYLLTEYHYYDEGYDLRFDGVNGKSAKDCIYDYASVLNDKMMSLLKIKVSPYVVKSGSVGDKCKKLTYGSVKSNDISKQCPKTSAHKSDSCLQAKYYRETLSGNKYHADVVWTGHILLNNARSTSTYGPGSIVITPYKVVNQSTYKNLSDYEIRRKQISTLMHETIHQFKIHDHYCYEDWDTSDGKCSNLGCYSCYNNNIKPDCMMMDTKYPTETNDLLCGACKSGILDYWSSN